MKPSVLFDNLGFILACLGSLFCLIPWFQDSKPNSNGLLNGTSFPLFIELKTHKFYNACIISIATTFPILFDFAIDMYLKLNSSFVDQLTSWQLILSTAIPCVIITCYCVPEGDSEILPPLLWTRNLFILFSGAKMLRFNTQIIWSNVQCRYIHVIYLLIAILSVILPYACDAKIQKLSATITCLEILILINFIILSYQSIRVIFTVLKWNDLNEDDVGFLYSTAHLIGLFLFLFAVFINQWMNLHSHNIFFQRGEYSTNLIYIQTTYAVILTLTSRRFKRRKVLYDMAKTELELKKTLVGYFSHEIRTPLNSISLGLELLKRKLYEDKVASEMMTEIQISCNSANDILNDLLTYEKLESKKLELNKINVPVKSFLDNIFNTYVAEADDKGVILKIDYSLRIKDWSKVMVELDEGKFGRVVRNLLTNAIYSSENTGNVSIQVYISRTTESNQTLKAKSDMVVPTDISRKCILHVVVTDSGSGLSKTDQEKLFKDAISFTAGVLQAREGTGLGLWISRKFMNLHDGDLAVTSKGEGFGSTYTVTIPVQYCLADEEDLGSRKSRSSIFHSFIAPNLAAIGRISSRVNVDVENEVTDGIVSGQPQAPPLSSSRKKITSEMSNSTRVSPLQREMDAKTGAIADSSSFLNTEDSMGSVKAVSNTRIQPKSMSNKPMLQHAQSWKERRENLSLPIPSKNRNVAATDEFQRDSVEDYTTKKHSNKPSEFSNVSNTWRKGHSSAQIYDMGFEQRNIPLWETPSIGSDSLQDSGMNGGLLPSRASIGRNQGEHAGQIGLTGRGNIGQGHLPGQYFHTGDISVEFKTEEKEETQTSSNTGLLNESARNTMGLSDYKEEKANDTNDDDCIRILVVDDAPLNAKMMCRLLDGYCDETILARNGEEAVEQIQHSMTNQQRISLVLMDYQMPKMDGPTAAREMRTLGYEGPVIGVTGNVLDQDCDTFLDNGANLVLQKPLKFQDLKDALREMNLETLLENKRKLDT